MMQQALFDFCLRMGDSYLILGHRLSERCGHGPILEQDIAMTNIALDELGQARFYLDYAAQVEGKGRTEDDLAFFRDLPDYKNALLTEQPNGDFAHTLARQFLFDLFNQLLVEKLCDSADAQLKAISEKAIKEINYHVRFSTDWILRLGDGTEDSHNRLTKAFDDLWMFTDDLFEEISSDQILIADKIIPSLQSLREPWSERVRSTLEAATLTMPHSPFMMKGSRGGNHTEHLGFLLAEMQFMQRTYPGCKW